MASIQFGRYKIRREIGRGGMATVYQAWDPRFEREVAIKVLPYEYLHNPTFMARFEREAKIIAALEHPGIVPVYDFGEQDGQPYLVMRYMPGRSLKDRLESGPLTVQEAARIIRRIAPALDYAHEKGVIHRDLKPDNILFDQHGEPYLTDFGIAKLSESSQSLTGATIVGTPAYMSPEQARGEEGLDGRSDIYALGANLFEMLSGQLPYSATTPMGMAMKHVTEPVPNILERRRGLPPDLQEIITLAMAKSKESRYNTASDLSAALESVSRGETLPGLVRNKILELSTNEGEAAPRPQVEVPSLTSQPTQKTVRTQRPAWPRSYYVITTALLIFLSAGAILLLSPGLRNREPKPSSLGPIVTATTPAPSVELSSQVPSQIGFVSLLRAGIGTAYYQPPEGVPALLRYGERIPISANTRLWTSGGPVQLEWSRGPVLALGEETALVVGAEEGDHQAVLLLEKGRLLVKAYNLVVRSADSTIQAEAGGALMGIFYDPGKGLFQVDCLEAHCRVGNLELSAWERGGYSQGSLSMEVGAAEAQPWLALGLVGGEPTSSAVSTWTATPQPSATLMETPTPTKTSTRPAPKPTATRTRTPKPDRNQKREPPTAPPP